jgi:hypothetical protein
VTFIAAGNAQISTTDPIEGTGSLLLDGNGDYLYTSDIELSRNKFTVECFLNFDNLGTQMEIMGDNTNRSFVIRKTASDEFIIWVSSNGSSFDVFNGVTGSGASSILTAGQDHHFVFEHDNTSTDKYKIYLDGVEVFTSTTSGKLHTGEGFRLGSWYNTTSSETFKGKIDSFRVTYDENIYYQEFLKPDVDLTPADYLWFDTIGMKMYQGNSIGGWVQKNILMLGEAVTDGSSVTSVTTYAYNGRYDSDAFNVANNTKYTKAHNIGTDYIRSTKLERQNSSHAWAHNIRIYNSAYYGGSLSVDNNNAYLDYDSGTEYIGDPNTHGDDAFTTSTSTTGQARLILERAF